MRLPLINLCSVSVPIAGRTNASAIINIKRAFFTIATHLHAFYYFNITFSKKFVKFLITHPVNHFGVKFFLFKTVD